MKKKGFTLVEFLSVTVLLGIILVISLPLFGDTSSKAKESVLKSKIDSYNSAAILYSQDHKYYMINQLINTKDDDSIFRECKMNSNDEVYACSVSYGDLAEKGYIKYDEGKRLVNPNYPKDSSHDLNQIEVFVAYYKKLNKFLILDGDFDSGSNNDSVDILLYIKEPGVYSNVSKQLMGVVKIGGNSVLKAYYFGSKSLSADINDNDWVDFGAGENDISLSLKVVENGKYYLWVKDSNNTLSYKSITVSQIDKVAPSCELIGEGTNWAKDRKITINCIDDNSGCVNPSYTKVFTGTKTTAKMVYTFSDRAGNKTTCSYDNVKVYIDNEGPKCASIVGNNVCTSEDVTVSVNCSDSGSGCTKDTFTKLINYTSDYDKVTISDKLGNTTDCLVSTKVDKTPSKIKYTIFDAYLESILAKYFQLYVAYSYDEVGCNVSDDKYTYIINDSTKSSGYYSSDGLQTETYFDIKNQPLKIKLKSNETGEITEVVNLTDFKRINYHIVNGKNMIDSIPDSRGCSDFIDYTSYLADLNTNIYKYGINISSGLILDEYYNIQNIKYLKKNGRCK